MITSGISIGTFFMIGIYSLLAISILVFVHAFFLWLVTSKLLKFEKKDFLTSLKVTSIVSISTLVLGIFPIVGIFIMTVMYVFLIKYFFKVDFKKAFIAWLITVVLGVSIISAVAIVYLTGLLYLLRNLTLPI